MKAQFDSLENQTRYYDGLIRSNNDVRLPLDLPEKVFVAAWNQLVGGSNRLASDWQQTMDGGDLLQQYRAKELIRLIDEVGILDSMPYELILKVLDHIEVEKVGCDHNFHVILESALQPMTHKIHSGKQKTTCDQ